MNLGFAGGVNSGLETVDTPWVATLNPDAVPATNWVSALRSATERYPDAAFFGSRQMMASDADLLDGFGDVYSVYGIPWRGGRGKPAARIMGDIEVLSPCAAAALYRADVLRSLGGFDERFFCYLEDLDIGIRARAAGYRTIQLKDAVVVHAGSAITGENSCFTLYYSYRNRVWLLFKNMPVPLLFVCIPLFVAANTYLLIRTARSQPLKPRLRGLWHGFLGLRPFIGFRNWPVLSTNMAIRALVWNPKLLKNRAVVQLGPAKLC